MKKMCRSLVDDYRKSVPDYTVSKEELDLGVITFDIDANLTEVFDWNVKQLFLYLAAEYETKSNKVNQVRLRIPSIPAHFFPPYVIYIFFSFTKTQRKISNCSKINDYDGIFFVSRLSYGTKSSNEVRRHRWSCPISTVNTISGMMAVAFATFPSSWASIGTSFRMREFCRISPDSDRIHLNSPSNIRKLLDPRQTNRQVKIASHWNETNECKYD